MLWAIRSSRYIQTKDWPAIIADWSTWCEGEGAWMAPLRDFTAEVAQSKYAFGLYAYISMQTLAIAQTPEVWDFQERLLVRFNYDSQKLQMAFTDEAAWIWISSRPRMRDKESWYRECQPADAFGCFEKFLRQVGWSPESLKPLG